MERTVLWFAKFNGADLKGANFTDADLSQGGFLRLPIFPARTSRGRISTAPISSGAIGIADAKGIDQAVNLDRALR